MSMLGNALRAVETGAADMILILGGDATGLAGYAKVAANYNTATQKHLSPLGHGGPNGVYALVASRQIKKYGLEKSDYGHIAIAQREWAAKNPYAVYRTPLTMEEYLAAPLVADPLSRYDCVPVVAGAQAIIVARPDRAPKGRPGVRVRAHRASYNYDNQEGDGLADRHQHVRQRAVAGGGRAAGRHRRRQHLRRLSDHGAGAGQRSRPHSRQRSGAVLPRDHRREAISGEHLGRHAVAPASPAATPAG